MQFQINNTQVYGLERAVKASGNPMRTKLETTEQVEEADFRRARNLARTKGGEGHDNFLKGILVQLDVTAPLYWWKEAQRYHWFDFISSQSTMHCLLKFNIEERVVDEVHPKILQVIRELVAEYKVIDENDKIAQIAKWRQIVASLPSGFCLSATMTTNYQQLKTMYFQRRNHKLIEWHQFATWCEGLPYFKDFVLNE
ncbi:MAG: hypothetical protein WCX47_03105 [Bacilli bacterium]|jgi:hypothetical protein|nr:hypothetical protein [Bacilli bacterium]MDD3389398.1 hypothetical protein [Bacilli bacterium]MDD4344849.1 hypothetical protein [Bacilli bacterium]MDD4520765.1 hypothetical protein [Bacilli bacterium]MDY0399461.1 hypothetical protein [Bacilli bacterium]